MNITEEKKTISVYDGLKHDWEFWALLILVAVCALAAGIVWIVI